jgi:hypothetical protein
MPNLWAFYPQSDLDVYIIVKLVQFIGVYTGSVILLFLADIIHGIAGKLIYINLMVMLTRFLKREDYELATLGWFIFKYF